MSESTEAEAISLVCVRCGHLNDERASRCGQCRSPLDDFASTSPWEMGKVKASAYSPAASPRSKPIIFWGVWLYFGPTAIWAVYYLFGEIRRLHENADLSDLLTLDFVMAHALMILYTAVSFWVLWAVTKGYLQKESPVEK